MIYSKVNTRNFGRNRGWSMQQVAFGFLLFSKVDSCISSVPAVCHIQQLNAIRFRTFVMAEYLVKGVFTTTT